MRRLIAKIGLETFWILRRLGTLAADSEPCDLGAVQEHVNLLAGPNGPNHRIGKVSSQADLHHILAVEREVVANERAAACVIRQLFVHALVLPEAARDVEGLDGRTGPRIADGEPADLLRREHIPLEESRRNREDVSDVVEPVVRLVGRQQRSRVDVQREQVPNRVGVLHLIQAMIRGAAGIRMGRRLPIQLRLQPRHERLEGLLIRPSSASRWHRAAPNFLHDFFPDFCAGTDVLDVGLVEREPSRLELLVVAGDAVVVEERARGGC